MSWRVKKRNLRRRNPSSTRLAVFTATTPAIAFFFKAALNSRSEQEHNLIQQQSSLKESAEALCRRRCPSGASTRLSVTFEETMERLCNGVVQAGC
jgi:hypothetical protein